METVIFYEDKQKQEFASSFESRDLDWWETQINNLSAKKNVVSNQRILGYISLAAWSYSTKAIEMNNIPLAKKSLEIYKLADPENSEQPYLKACLYAKNNEEDSAFYFLNDAVKMGLKDRSKIENEKNFISLRQRNEYAELLGRLNQVE